MLTSPTLATGPDHNVWRCLPAYESGTYRQRAPLVAESARKILLETSKNLMRHSCQMQSPNNYFALHRTLCRACPSSSSRNPPRRSVILRHIFISRRGNGTEIAALAQHRALLADNARVAGGADVAEAAASGSDTPASAWWERTYAPA